MPLNNTKAQVKKKERKLKLLGPDVFRWGGDLAREGVGPKSSVCPSKLTKTKLFAGTTQDFCMDIPGRATCLRTECLCSIL